MLISAIGILIDHKLKSKHRNPAGFSLLELLVVLLIIGVLIGGLTFSINPGIKDVETEARRFGTLVEMAIDQAILNSEEYAIQLTPDRYLFLVDTKNKWQPIDGADVFRDRVIPGNIEVELFLDEEKVKLERGYKSLSEKETMPQIFLYSSGEITPFTVLFNDNNSGLQYKIEEGSDRRIKITKI